MLMEAFHNLRAHPVAVDKIGRMLLGMSDRR